ncbi:MAG: DNA recombination protein RmuC [Bacilli bacterium]|nr:DNA recombination protein RmuC [Bacilli bacterium]
MEIAILIVSIVVALLIIVAIILLIRKKTPVVNGNVDLKELGSISNEINHLSKDINNNIQLAVSKEMQNFYVASNKTNESNNEKLERFQKNINESLNTRFDALNEQMVNRLNDINKKVDEKLQEGFKGTSESMTQVRERLQAIDDAQKNIETLSKDVISLKQVLEGNQTRGQYGEYRLSMVLNNVFGDTIGCYEEQYTIKKARDGNDVRADAVVFMPEPNKMICIDSKFPFQDYSRIFETNDDEEVTRLVKDFSSSVKKHITAIKDKYIVEGKTAPEAIMFVPNDGVFAFIHQNCLDAVEYAREQRVILTSPSTLPSILVTINMVRIEVERAKNVREITKQLNRLSKDFEMFGREWDTFSTQLERATNSREKLDKRVGRITNKFDAIKTNNSDEFDDGGDAIEMQEGEE